MGARGPDEASTLPRSHAPVGGQPPAPDGVDGPRQMGTLVSAVLLVVLFSVGLALAHPWQASGRVGVAVPTSTSLPPAPPFGLGSTPGAVPTPLPTEAPDTSAADATETPDASLTPTPPIIRPPLPAYLLVQPKQQNPEQPCASGNWPDIVLTNAGGQALDWSATTSTGAVDLDVSSGTLGPNESLTVHPVGQLTNTAHPFIHIYFRWNGGLITATIYCTV